MYIVQDNTDKQANLTLVLREKASMQCTHVHVQCGKGSNTPGLEMVYLVLQSRDFCPQLIPAVNTLTSWGTYMYM